jgi:phosphoglycolate phosphatase
MILPKPTAVIFDWDNTLVDTWPIIHSALNATFRETGKPEWNITETMARVSKSMRDSFPIVFGENWQKAGDIYQMQYRAIHLERLKALPHAEEVLKKVKEKGLHCVVVSNKKGPNLRKEIQHIGWSDYFENAIGADDAAKDKPHADPVNLAFAETDIVPAKDVWFIGDSEIDLHCAKNTGCTAVLFGETPLTHPEYTKTHYIGFPYDAHVHNHTETLKLLSF